MWRGVAVLWLIVGVCAPAHTADFDTDIRPILQQHCIACHGSKKQEGGLRLDQRAAALRGGENYAPAIVPQSAEKSPLWQFVSREDADLKMPPDGAGLSATEVQLLKEWIDAGAVWPDASADLSEKSAHWSFQPLVRPACPGNSTGHEIDAFIRARLNEDKLTFNPQADRQTLIRRLSFDLLGLPPTPEEVAAFEADKDPQAWERLVDRYLASPHFGERAARFWLDTVRFAESDGFETNQPRPNAWRYRDYVINAFNSDLPYDQFIKQQLAGDQLGVGAATGFIVGGAWDRVKSPDPVLTAQQRADELHDMVSTTGSVFLGLTVGCSRCHSHKFDPIPQTDYYALKATFEGVMHGEREIESMRSPESQQRATQLRQEITDIDSQLREYEPLASLQSAHLIRPTDAERTIPIQPFTKSVLATGMQRGAAQDQGHSPHWPNLSSGFVVWKAAPQTDTFAWKPQLNGTYRFWISWACGPTTHSTDAVYILDRDGDRNTTEDQKQLRRVDQQRFNDGSDELADLPLWSGFKDAGLVELAPQSIVLLRQGNQESFVTADLAMFQEASPDSPSPPEDRPRVRVSVTRDLNIDKCEPVKAKHVRFTVLATSGSEPCLDELEVFTAERKPKNVALSSLGTKATASGTLPNVDIHKLEHINDGHYGNAKSWISNEAGRGWVALEFAEPQMIDEFRWSRDRGAPPQYADRVAKEYLIETSLDGQTWVPVAGSGDRLPFGMSVPGGRLIRVTDPKSFDRFDELQTRRRTLAKELAPLVESAKAYAGQFVKPGPTYRLSRGDVTQPKEVVAPGSLSELGQPVALSADAPEAQRRIALADWIINRDNPLTARVIVNRVWLQHFGEGIVDTPSDFGANGGKPTHPDLLNWLACELREPSQTGIAPWSLKHIHRLICLSETYQQSSEPREDGLAVDAASRLLWRFPPRRLEAESIRDSILSVSGNLDLREGGPGFDLFEPNTNYVKVYNSKREFGRDDFRRMIYQSKPRMQLEDTFGTFDCPDAGQVTPKRTSSTTALQALSLLNSPFLLQQSEAFAKRVEESSPKTPDAQVERAFLLGLGRLPTADERAASVRLVQQYGLPLLCRAIYNTHEFVSVR
jgi:mono/diheme cytochrome c family protein